MIAASLSSAEGVGMVVEVLTEDVVVGVVLVEMVELVGEISFEVL